MSASPPVLTAYVESPIGLLEIAAGDGGITAVAFVEAPRHAAAAHPLLETAVAQLAAYFQRRRRAFDLPLAPLGTPFQQAVWRQLLQIPYGQTASYQAVAAALDRPRAVRAVGAANGQNPLAVVIPCHRVIGSNGRLTGYGGGLWRKEWLLRHEGSLLL